MIIDMHGAPGGQSDDQCTGHGGQNKLWLPENRKRAAFLWKAIAERYRGNPTIAAYDLLNEPYGNHGNDPSDATYVATVEELIHAIRPVDQGHLILCAGNIRGLTGLGTPASHGWKNVGYTEHFYPGLFGGVPGQWKRTRALSVSTCGRRRHLYSKSGRYLLLAGRVQCGLRHSARRVVRAMMRRYYDIFASHGWAATMWTYKMVNAPRADASQPG